MVLAEAGTGVGKTLGYIARRRAELLKELEELDAAERHFRHCQLEDEPTPEHATGAWGLSFWHELQREAVEPKTI